MNTSFPQDIQSYVEFTNAIVNHFHTPTRSAIEEIATALSTLLEHNSTLTPLQSLTTAMHDFTTAMETHLTKEETMLFPMIQGIETTIDFTYKSGLMKPIAKMETEHKEHEVHIERINGHIAELQTIATPEIETLLHRIKSLIELTREHTYVEDSLLFKRIKTR